VLSAQLNDEQFVKAAKNTVRILIRRPHAYRFRKDYPGTPIPGLVLMDSKGKVLDSIRLPARGGAKTLVELFQD
jgi:hypothetical protein